MFFFSFHFTVRQDYLTHFELSKLNREILEETNPRRNEHLSTRKQNLACLTWPELDSNPQHWNNERFRVLNYVSFSQFLHLSLCLSLPLSLSLSLSVSFSFSLSLAGQQQLQLVTSCGKVDSLHFWYVLIPCPGLVGFLQILSLFPHRSQKV